MKWLHQFWLAVFVAAMTAGEVSMGEMPGKADESQRNGNVLQKLNEPELAAQPKSSSLRIYRAMIAPTWGNRFCIRIQNQGEGAIMIRKRLDGQAGYRDGALVEQKEFKLSAQEFQELETLVTRSGFDQMGLRDPHAGLDGDAWSLEVSKAGLHHTAVRWCPNAYDPKKRGTEGFVRVFRWLADRAGVTRQITNKGHAVFDR